MFEKASRLKLRFPYKGTCSVEDLWDLSVEELDYIFKELNAQLRLTKEESLLDTKGKEDEETELQVAIIRRVVEVKLQEAADKKASKEKKAQKQKLLSILATKQDAELQGKSVEELQAMINAL